MVWLRNEDQMDALAAVIEGPPDTPYAGGFFQLQISVPDKYPFHPPQGK